MTMSYPEPVAEPEQSTVFQVDDEVIFQENAEFPRALGVVIRVWTNGRYVSIRTDGRVFVRDVREVQLCDGQRGSGS